MSSIFRDVIVSDVHLETRRNKVWELIKKFIKAIQPRKVVLAGDFMDCTALSHWNQNKRLLMEGKRWRTECDMANKELDWLQKHSFSVVYLEGNHEVWIRDYVQYHPEMEGLIEIPVKLRLKERGIKWVENGVLYKVCKSLYATHGMYTNKYHAQKHLATYGCNIIYGHTHHPQTYMMNMKMQEPYMAWGIGSACSHKPDYLKGKHANWLDQFALVEGDSKTFNVTPINIVNNRFFYNGRIWEL